MFHSEYHKVIDDTWYWKFIGEYNRWIARIFPIFEEYPMNIHITS